MTLTFFVTLCNKKIYTITSVHQQKLYKQNLHRKKSLTSDFVVKKQHPLHVLFEKNLQNIVSYQKRDIFSV